MSHASRDNDVPSWDGSPNTFERFAVECRWYQFSLKSTERHLAAPRVWHELTGSAKSVVRNLNPEVYATANGLDKLLDVLRGSPLQRLPVPDTFQRLERWSNLHKRQGESIPQLIVREELFVELQQSLQRARGEKPFPSSSVGTGETVGAEEEDEQEAADDNKQEPAAAEGSSRKPVAREAPSPTSSTRSKTVKGAPEPVGFFEDELRGCRLLKACCGMFFEESGTTAGPDFDTEQHKVLCRSPGASHHVRRGLGADSEAKAGSMVAGIWSRGLLQHGLGWLALGTRG